MNVSLTPELERFVDAKVESGLYNNASEVVREGLRLLKEHDEVRLRWRNRSNRWQDAQAGTSGGRRRCVSTHRCAHQEGRRPQARLMAAFPLTPSAEEHIGDIVEFIAADDEDAAVRPSSKPLTIVAVLHGARDIAQILKEIG